jgi:hypothetical protein
MVPFKQYYEQKISPVIFEKCWKGYTKRGMKKKGKKLVPNCVKK